MKGIMIYGNPMWGDNARATYCEYIDNASFEISRGTGEIISCLEGETSKLSKTVCSKKDTYDFETGALIALMKMCGLEKSAKAYAEIFDDTAYGDALIERDKLKEKVDALYAYNKGLIDEIDQKNHEIIALKALKLTNESLKKDNASFRKTCEKLKEENERLKNTRDLLTNKNNELIEENKRLNASNCAKAVLNGKLLKDYNAAQSAYEIMVEKSADLMDKVKKLEEENKKLKDELKLKEDAINEWKQTLREQNTKIGDLVCENEKLKTDCEKLQHGYIDTDMIFCGGRQNGKQYKCLVNLFKKLPQDKIEAAYKEVFNTELPLWKKEFLNAMYGIYRESRKKEELPGTLDINGATYRKCDEKGRVVWVTDEFASKPASKREKMWDDILKEGRTPVYVKRKDVHDFLEECQIAGIKWKSGKMPLETIPFDVIEPTDAGIYFFVMTSRVPNGFRHVMTYSVLLYSDEDEQKSINYLPPMRWDLFEKGRLVVKVSKENYAEFCSRVLSHFYKVGVNAFNHDCKFGYFMFNKDTYYAERILASDCDGTKEINGHKVVDWEDVR